MEEIRQLNNLCGIDVGCTNIKMAAVIDEKLIGSEVLLRR